MKRFLAILTMFGNMFIVLSIIAGIQSGLRSSSISEGIQTIANIFTLLLTVADLTYINYLIWKKLT